MKRLLAMTVLSASFLSCALAQSTKFPAAALGAKTVAIENDTHVQAVTDGAVEEIKEWGHFRIVDDPDTADVVLRFSKKSSHDRSNTEKKNDDGTSSYGFSVSSSSSVTMEATLKDSFSPFYTTTTSESKQKAGVQCTQAFIGAYQDSRLKQ